MSKEESAELLTQGQTRKYAAFAQRPCRYAVTCCIKMTETETGSLVRVTETGIIDRQTVPIQLK